MKARYFHWIVTLSAVVVLLIVAPDRSSTIKQAQLYMHNRLMEIGFDFDIEVDGYRYSGNSANLIDRHIVVYGGFEKSMRSLFTDIARTAKRPSTFVDVGANTGYHSLLLARHVDRVIAFEPFPPVIARFEHNLGQNPFTNIVLHKVGLGEKNHDIQFYHPPIVNSGIGTFSSDFANPNSLTDSEILPIRVGDDFLGELELGTVIIKIDVEGFERLVLEGLQKTLNKYRPTLIVEVTPFTESGYDSRESFERSFPSEYRFFVIKKSDFTEVSYKLTNFDFDLKRGTQHNIVAVPNEVQMQLSGSS